MSKFRERSVDAVQWTGENEEECRALIGPALWGGTDNWDRSGLASPEPGDHCIWLNAWAVNPLVRLGDWIVKRGEQISIEKPDAQEFESAGGG